MSIDPAKTFAVLIGIEDYAISAGLKQPYRWDLNGPASDAVRFAEWLRSKNVPADNIYPFISALEPQRIETEFAALGIDRSRILEPSQTRLAKFLSETLGGIPDASGDAQLFLLWGGHGILRQSDIRHLYCSDVSPALQLTLNLNDLLRALRSHKKFRRQLLFIDACANAHENTRNPKPMELAGAWGGAPTSVEQHTLLAASAGQKAKNLTYERAGLFSKLLKETLTPFDLDVDFHEVERAVIQKFAEEHLKNSALVQLPVTISVEDARNNYRSLNFGGTPVPRSIQVLADATGYSVASLQNIALVAARCEILSDAARSAALSEALGIKALVSSSADPEYLRLNFLAQVIGDRNKFSAFFNALRCQESDYLAYLQLSESFARTELVREARNQLRPLPVGDHTDLQRIFSGLLPHDATSLDIESMLTALADTGPRASSKLFEFLYRLSECATCTRVEQLRRWIKETADPDYFRQLEAESQARRTYAVIISIKTKPGVKVIPESFTLYLLENGRANLVPINEKIDNPADLQPLLESALERALKLVPAGTPIQLAIPLELMRFQFGSLGKKGFSHFKRLFATDYPLSVRWRDRHFDPLSRQYWHATSKLIRTHLNQSLKAQWETLAPHPDDQYLTDLLNKPPDFLFLGAIEPPAHQSEPDWLHEVIINGTPFAAWTIAPPANPNNLAPLIDKLLNPLFDELPKRTTAIRKDLQFADLHSMVLLWDDPQQFPAVLLSEPN